MLARGSSLVLLIGVIGLEIMLLRLAGIRPGIGCVCGEKTIL